jgi:nitrogen fixation/metabolism regulation signal transduction histidine kinase
MEEGTPGPTPSGRHQRRLRNYLLDARFQLKYTGYIVGIAFALSAALGTIVWRTSGAVISQSEEAVRVAEGSVEVGEQVVDRGREVVQESQKVSAVVRMNIVKDPAYGDNPALLAAFQEDANRQDELLAEQQRQLEAQSQQLKAQSANLKSQADWIERKHNSLSIALLLVLTLLVLGVGAAGIVVTHKVAGPIFKMKRQIRELGAGSLHVPSPLRKGDELVDFFEAFRSAVMNLRKNQEGEITMLDRAISNLEKKAAPEDLVELRALREEMQSALDRPSGTTRMRLG